MHSVRIHCKSPDRQLSTLKVFESAFYAMSRFPKYKRVSVPAEVHSRLNSGNIIFFFQLEDEFFPHFSKLSLDYLGIERAGDRSLSIFSHNLQALNTGTSAIFDEKSSTSIAIEYAHNKRARILKVVMCGVRNTKIQHHCVMVKVTSSIRLWFRKLQYARRCHRAADQTVYVMKSQYYSVPSIVIPQISHVNAKLKTLLQQLEFVVRTLLLRTVSIIPIQRNVSVVPAIAPPLVVFRRAESSASFEGRLSPAMGNTHASLQLLARCTTGATATSTLRPIHLYQSATDQRQANECPEYILVGRTGLGNIISRT